MALHTERANNIKVCGSQVGIQRELNGQRKDPNIDAHVSYFLEGATAPNKSVRLDSSGFQSQ